jgi:hypothetical protein
MPEGGEGMRKGGKQRKREAEQAEGGERKAEGGRRRRRAEGGRQRRRRKAEGRNLGIQKGGNVGRGRKPSNLIKGMLIGINLGLGVFKLLVELLFGLRDPPSELVDEGQQVFCSVYEFLCEGVRVRGGEGGRHERGKSREDGSFERERAEGRKGGMEGI